MAALTSLPWFALRVVRMMEHITVDEYSYRILSEVFQVWLSLSTILVPIIYLSTCPTYFRRVFPESRFRLLYSLGLGKEKKNGNSVLPNIGRDLLQNAINVIQEECEEDEYSDSEDYIELPAVTITIDRPPNNRTNSLHLRGDSDDGSGITYENGHAAVSSIQETPS